MSEQSEDEITVTLILPGPAEKGFLRRVREVQAIMDLSKDGITGTYAMWEKFADYLIERGYVSVPEGTDAHDAILELSQDELARAVGQLAGLTLPKTVDPPNGAA
jgi:hypothetical protein